MRILVTGGAGFIGSHVAALLRDAGHVVAILDDFSTGQRENIPDGAICYDCDIRDPRLAMILAEFRPELISHHAAQMSVRVSIQRPRFDATVNIEGGINLLESARHAGTRKIVYASTGGAVYGEPQALPCDENHPIAPLCHYGLSKYTFEGYLALYKRLYGLDYTVLRYPNVYGPRQDPDGEAGVVAIFARRMLQGLPITIYGDGQQERDFIFVGDVARATLAALTAAPSAVINLGSGIGTSVRTIFDTLAELTGYMTPPRFEAARLGEVYRIYLTGIRARTLLGWTPTVTLRAGLADTVAWIREQETASIRSAPAPLATGT